MDNISYFKILAMPAILYYFSVVGYAAPSSTYQPIDFTYGNASINGATSSLSSTMDYVAAIGGNPCPISNDFINGYDTQAGQSKLSFTFNTPLVMTVSDYIYLDYYYFNDIQGNSDLSRYLPNQDITFFTSAGNITGSIIFTNSMDSALNNQEWLKLRIVAPYSSSSALTINGLEIGIEMNNIGTGSSFSTSTSEVFALALEGIGANETLPVEFLYFNARLEERDIVLNWSTISELNNKRYEIQHATPSLKAPMFKAIGSLNGAGTTTEVQYYNYTIKNIIPGTHYFRLKQIDFDGSFSYSSIQALTIKETLPRKLFPSFLPKASARKIYIKINEGGNYKIEIISISGHLLRTDYVNIQADKYHEIGLDYQSGMYLIYVSGKYSSFVEKVQIE